MKQAQWPFKRVADPIGSSSNAIGWATGVAETMRPRADQMLETILRILIVSFYYPPDLAAGSFRAAALVKELRRRMKPGDTIRVVTTRPNRYASFKVAAEAYEEADGVSIERIELPAHSSRFADQSRAFLRFARQTLRRCRGERPDLVFATSSRLMTAALGAEVARRTRAPLYLDIRDLFTDTMGDLLSGPFAGLVPFIRLVERRTFRHARHINVVSPGFVDHIVRIRGRNDISVHTNGVDVEFIGRDFSGPTSDPPVILYAGNVGEGQGLDQIVPAAARLLAGRYRFKVIGAGGGLAKLERALMTVGIAPPIVELLPPVPRDRLLEEYRAADVLFLHLNAYKAFEKVIPSKVFEYAATGKPILAGIQGTSRNFVERNVVNAKCFSPCDADGFVRALEGLDPVMTDRSAFAVFFSRETIMARMVEEIIACARD